MHIITGLGNGGAEKNLTRLCEHTDKNYFEVIVVSLKNAGVYGEYLKGLGIQVIYLNLHEKPKLRQIFTLLRIIKNVQPDIIQTWLYHADLIGVLAAKMARIEKVIWNIRSTKLNFKDNSWHVVVVRKVCALLSFMPTKIINCSQTSIAEHIKVGYRKDKFVYIPNGYNLESLYSDSDKALIKNEKIKIGIVGRNDPQKDFPNFFSAIKIIASASKNIASQIQVIVVGKGSFEVYQKDASAFEPLEIIFWGECSDMLMVYNSLDFLVLSSKSEAFPNVVAEAMACGKPCVSTDVGDAKIIIGDTGIVVKSSNSSELAQAMLEMICLGKIQISKLGERARRRIEEKYSLNMLINKYENLYKSVLESK